MSLKSCSLYEFLASQGRLSLSDLQKVFLRVHAAGLLSVACPRSDRRIACSRKNTFFARRGFPSASCLQHFPEPQFIKQPENKSYTQQVKFCFSR